MKPAQTSVSAIDLRARSARWITLLSILALAAAACRAFADEPVTESALRLSGISETPSPIFRVKFSLEISRHDNEAVLETSSAETVRDGATIKLATVLRRINPAEDALSRLLARSGAASRGALAIGGLRVGYGQIFLPTSVVDTGRTGTAWEEPGCFQIKTCFRF